jgi:SAM-dependent methyltransferase
MAYNPKAYWEWRGQEGRYNPAPQHEELDIVYDWLFREIRTVHTFLEIGSGTGRVANYFIKEKLAVIPRYYSCCDISASMAALCKQNTGIQPLVIDGPLLPYTQKTFDCVILFYVLLHVIPAELETLFTEAMRVSNDYILINSLYSPEPLELKEHCFNHDLPALFNKYQVHVIRHVTKGNNHTWLLKKYS